MTIYSSPCMPRLSQHTGDIASGCACAYALLPVSAKEKLRAEKHTVNGCNNVDVFESSTGTRVNKYVCHQLFTGKNPQALQSPVGWQAKDRIGSLSRTVTCLGDAMLALIKFVFPKFNFGVGVNLWRFDV